MTAPLLALSLSNKLIEVGALAAFAGLVGIAVLSLLVFSQAREIKRLREWAGRAPERAAELEQRVSAEAAIRIQRTVQPVPRATPVVARPIGDRPAVAAGPAAGLAGGVAATAAGEAVPGQPTPSDQPTPTPVPGQPAFVPSVQSPPSSNGPEAPVQPPAAAGVAQAADNSKPAEDQKPEDQKPESTSTGEEDALQPAGASSDAQGEQVATRAEPVAAAPEPETEAEPGRVAPATVAAVAAATGSAAVASRVLEPVRPVPARSPAPPVPARPATAAPARPPLPPARLCLGVLLPLLRAGGRGLGRGGRRGSSSCGKRSARRGGRRR